MPTDLLSLLSARNGHFLLESGHHGSLWLDLEMLFVRQSHIRPFVYDLANKLSRYSVEAVCGPLVGGAFLSQSLAGALDIEFTYADRLASPPGHTQGGSLGGSSINISGAVTYRLPRELQARLRDKRVAVVDDVINAGSAVRATCVSLRSCGAVPVVVGALLVLGPTAAQGLEALHLPLESAATLPNEIWIPEECPLCAEQVPLEQIP